MFKSIYNELKIFFRGPIINNHNKPLPPMLKEYIEKTQKDITISSSCFIVKSEDETRFYVEYIKDIETNIEKEYRFLTVLMHGKETSVFLIPKISGYGLTFESLVEKVVTVLMITLDNCALDNTSKCFAKIKAISLPVMYCVLIKNLLGQDMVSVDDLYTIFIKKVYFYCKEDKPYTDPDVLSCIRFISKEFFQYILDTMECINDYESRPHLDHLCSEFIYKYLDCSFILLEPYADEFYISPFGNGMGEIKRIIGEE